MESGEDGAGGPADAAAAARGPYGEPVLAVADAVVSAVRDDVPESIAGAPPPSLADETGNYIALDLGGGRLAFYEHLAPGLSVRAGDRVRRGQVSAFTTACRCSEVAEPAIAASTLQACEPAAWQIEDR